MTIGTIFAEMRQNLADRSFPAFWLGMIAVLGGYRLDRRTHEDDLRQLAEARATVPPVSTF